MQDFSHPNKVLTRSVLLLAASAVALSACAPSRLAAPALQQPSQLASSRSFQTPAQAWPDAQWWRVYQDPQLTRLIEEGLAGSPTLTVAAARVRQAEAALGQWRSTTLPSIGSEAAVSSARQSANAMRLPEALRDALPTDWSEQGRVAVSLGYQLDFFGHNRAEVAAATSNAEAARMEEAAARLQLSSAIAATYADLVGLSQERQAASQIVDLRQASENLVRQRVGASLENDGALAQAQSETAAALGDLVAIEGAVMQTRHALAALVGKGPDRGLDIELPNAISVKAMGLPADAGIALVGRRPDIAAARARVEAAARRVDVAESDFYPNISLNAVVGLQSVGLGAIESAGSRSGEVGPAISLPIFSGGRLTSALRGAEAQYQAAVATYNQTLIDALRDVADAVTNRQTLDAQLVPARAALAAAEDAHRVARQRYEAGLSTYIEVLSIENRLVVRRLELERLDSRAFALDVALVRALGGGFSVSSI